jgi:hypothetical protein
LLVAACLLPACREFTIDAPPDPDDPVPGDITAELGVAFQLSVGESARIDELDLAVRFLATTDDSRCPRDTDCTSPGQVGASFQVERDAGLPVRFQLWVPGLVDAPYLRGDVFQSERERFRLLWISPYPDSTASVDPDSVRAILRIDHGL